MMKGRKWWGHVNVPPAVSQEPQDKLLSLPSAVCCGMAMWRRETWWKALPPMSAEIPWGTRGWQGGHDGLLFYFTRFYAASIPLRMHVILSSARNHPRTTELDSPRPRRRREQRPDLPCCNQLAESRRVTHLEQSPLFVFFLHRRTGNTLGTEVLFSTGGKIKGKISFSFLHLEKQPRERAIQPT